MKESMIKAMNLPFDTTPSYCMSYHDYEVQREGEMLKVAYLADDQDCQNPLEDCDGLGSIYTAHRNAGKEHHEAMKEALALDRDWDPDLSLLESGAPNLAFRKAWIAAATQHVEFRAWADETGRRNDPDEKYYRRRATAFWRECDSYSVNIWHFNFTDEVAFGVWKDLREQGAIGHADMVQLDCYEHGGQVWSITGSGHQCRFDTSRGAGVWVPDDAATQAIDSRQGVYAFGTIDKCRGEWRVRCDSAPSDMSELFPSWVAAYEWLSTFSEGKKVTKEMLELGRSRARCEVCSDALEQYNAWLAGNCFGVVVAKFSNVGSEATPEWELVDSEEVWGYVGDCAAEELPHVIH
ncbi:TPA: hypothetical protein QHB43_003043 [Aeromonas hydrophila subsp. hydrophila]|nr:hypothetical protein [Aeromonas hydrophila subsp. hydrophila]